MANRHTRQLLPTCESVTLFYRVARANKMNTGTCLFVRENSLQGAKTSLVDERVIQRRYATENGYEFPSLTNRQQNGILIKFYVRYLRNEIKTRSNWNSLTTPTYLGTHIPQVQTYLHTYTLSSSSSSSMACNLQLSTDVHRYVKRKKIIQKTRR